LFDPDHRASKGLRQHTRGPAEAGADIDDGTRHADFGRHCECQHRLNAARVILIGNTGVRIDGERPLVQSSERNTLALGTRQKRALVERVRGVDRVETDDVLIAARLRQWLPRTCSA
jgi:hypothetical protein